MKFHITSPDAFARVDGTVQRTLLSHLPNLVGAHDADVIVVPISFYQDFQFRRDLPAIIGSKRWILVDYLELGLDWEPNGVIDSHLLGRNSANFARVSGPEWMRLDAFVRDHPPLVYFRRELLAREHSDSIRPLEFPGYLPIPTIQSREEFNSRPVEAFHYWGLSHRSRPVLHGDIFRHSYDKGYEVLSEWGHWHGFFSNKRNRVWSTIHAPHFARVGIEHIQHYIHRSKLTVSLPGAGVRCFRDLEAAAGSIPTFGHTALGWSFPFIHGQNCIEIRLDHAWEDLYKATQRGDLYDIYVESQRNAENFVGANYVNRHIIPSIERRL
jgi:hypothetical protein